MSSSNKGVAADGKSSDNRKLEIVVGVVSV